MRRDKAQQVSSDCSTVDVTDRRPVCLSIGAVDAPRGRSNLLLHIGIFRNLAAAFGCDLQISHFAPPVRLRLEEQLECRKAMSDPFRVVPRAVAAVLKPGGEFAVINWHRWPREETTVLGKPRGPKTDIRMEPPETAATITGSDLTLARVVELPPYHYGAIFGRI